MNGLPSTDNGANRAAAEASEAERLESFLRYSAHGAKVIFGARKGTFDLSRADIENFFHLIDQRVREQNSCGADICEVSVYYSDGSSRKFPSVGEFTQYAETRNRFPTVVSVHLAYLILFPDSSEPEKQEIDIVIRSSDSTRETIEMEVSDSKVRMSGDKIQVGVSQDESEFGVISYNINHTRISWGLDLEGHIIGHIESLLEEPSKGDRTLRRLAGPLNLFTTIFAGLYFVNLIIDAFFSFLFQTDGAVTPSEMITVAAEYLVNGHIAKYIVATLVVSFVFFVLFSGIISRVTRSLNKPKPSFIILNESDTKRKKLKLKTYDRRWTKFLTLVAFNLVLALIVAYFETRLSSAWAVFSAFVSS